MQTNPRPFPNAGAGAWAGLEEIQPSFTKIAPHLRSFSLQFNDLNKSTGRHSDSNRCRTAMIVFLSEVHIT